MPSGPDEQPRRQHPAKTNPLRLTVERHLGGPAARRLLTNFWAVGAINALGLFTGLILARVLGPALRGELAAVLLWPQVVQALLSLGMTESVTYHAARQPGRLKSIIRTAGAVALMQGAAIVVVGALLVPLALSRYGSSSVVTALIFLGAMPVSLYALYMMHSLNGVHRYGWFNLAQILVFGVGAVVVAGLAMASKLTVRTAMLATVAGILVAFLVAVIGVERHSRGQRGGKDRGLARSMLAYGVRSHVSTFSNTLNDRLDQLVISLVLTPRDLGLYVVAWTMSSFTGFIGAAIAVGTLPTMATIGGPEEQRRAIRRALLLTLALTLPLAILLAGVMDAVIRLVFGARFEDAAGAAQILALASVLLALGRVLGAALKGIGRPLDAARMEAAGLAGTVLGLTLLIPGLGILGAAITSMLAYLTSVAVGMNRAAQSLGIPARFLLTRP